MLDHSRNNTYLYYELPQLLDSRAEEYPYEFVSKRIISNFHQLYWSVFSLGKYRRWELRINGETVSTAEVMPKMPFFCFMPNKGIHIGPCYTYPQHRGKGYYPILLKRIVSEYSPARCFIFCRMDNTASVKGITKAGGILYAEGHKTKTGFYIIDKKK